LKIIFILHMSLGYPKLLDEGIMQAKLSLLFLLLIEFDFIFLKVKFNWYLRMFFLILLQCFDSFLTCLCDIFLLNNFLFFFIDEFLWKQMGYLRPILLLSWFRRFTLSNFPFCLSFFLLYAIRRNLFMYLNDGIDTHSFH